jgi:hypothetical protein
LVGGERERHGHRNAHAGVVRGKTSINRGVITTRRAQMRARMRVSRVRTSIRSARVRTRDTRRIVVARMDDAFA